MSRFVGLKIRVERTNQSMRTNFEVTLNLDAIEWINWGDERFITSPIIHLKDRMWEIDEQGKSSLKKALEDNQSIWR